MDGNITVSTIRYNTVAIASDVRNDAVNAPTIVSDSRRNALKRSKGTHGQDLRVSTTHTPLVTE